jgi:hypothetical protein
MMKELTRQVRLIARVDAEGLSEALDPFGSRTDPTQALEALRAEMERLKEQIKALKTPATPQRPPMSLRDEWNVYATEVITKKKSFLKAEFQKRLSSEGIKAAESASSVKKSLNGVTGAQVKSLEKVLGPEKSRWASIDIPTLVAGEATLVKGVTITPEIENFWREIHELDHLLFYWPTEAIEDGELTR